MTGVAEGQLRSFVERIERVEEEVKALNTDKRDIYGEAKSMGFDTKVMKRVIQIRRQEPAKRIEEEAILDLYLHALGMAPDSPSRVHVHEEPQESVSVPPQKAERRPSELAGRSADASPATQSKSPARDAGPIPAHLDRRPTSHVGHA